MTWLLTNCEGQNAWRTSNGGFANRGPTAEETLSTDWGLVKENGARPFSVLAAQEHSRFLAALGMTIVSLE